MIQFSRFRFPWILKAQRITALRLDRLEFGSEAAEMRDQICAALLAYFQLSWALPANTLRLGGVVEAT